MTERLFICGLASQERSSSRNVLQLHGPDPNVRLQVDDIRKRLLDVEPERLTDFLEIAAYVFAADCAVRRGGPTLREMGKEWRRYFRLVIAVRDPGFWSSPPIAKALGDALGFLSEDTWAFEFEELTDPPSMSAYLRFRVDEDFDSAGRTSIVMFSGGLDSFAGAVQELSDPNRRVVLLSRRLGGITDQQQARLATELRKQHGHRVTHVPVVAGLTKETEAIELTQRTRTFLLTAIAAVAATIERAERICFFENGIVSINLPISAQVLGARASRSTHPRSLALMQALTRLIHSIEFSIDNPFLFQTKQEVVGALANTPFASAIPATLSCSHTRGITHATLHCGVCSQCLHRRISTMGPGVTERSGSYGVNFLTDPLDDGINRAMVFGIVQSALEYFRLSDSGFAARFARELVLVRQAQAAPDSADLVGDVVAMFRRHGAQVREILIRAVKEHAGPLVDGKLPASCLLRAIPELADISVGIEPIAPELADGQSDGPGDNEDEAEPDEFVVAVDQDRSWIRVEGYEILNGPQQFGLMSFLIQSHLEDRQKGLSADNYRSYKSFELLDQLGLDSENAVQALVSRIRADIRKGAEINQRRPPDSHAIIESVRGKQGYRLNPRVRVVRPDQIKNRSVRFECADRQPFVSPTLKANHFFRFPRQRRFFSTSLPIRGLSSRLCIGVQVAQGLSHEEVEGPMETRLTGPRP